MDAEQLPSIGSSDAEDRRVLLAAVDSFFQYRHTAHYNVTHVRRQSFYSLPSSHWTLLAEPPFSILDNLSAVDDAIDTNADIAETIGQTGITAFGISEHFGDHPPATNDAPNASARKARAKPQDLDKARSTLRQFYRDWSAEGAEERKACYDPVLDALHSEFAGIPRAGKGDISVLVPGAGLGRLVFNICRAGYAVEGNEISYHQLLASSFILNHTEQAEQYALYPWALNFTNHTNRKNQTQKVMIPDVHPGTALNEASEGCDVHAFERLGMSAADFCVTYKELHNREKYDAVATVFFIDTAPNPIAYIETVRDCLKSGGIWINLGPLLWHFDGSSGAKNTDDYEATSKHGLAGGDDALGIGDPGSVELTDEEVVKLVEHFGFSIERHETDTISAGYIQDPKSMLVNTYKPSFWIARKM